MRRKRRSALLTALIATLFAAAPARAVVLTQLGTFTDPVTMATPPGDVHRLFVVEQGGTIAEIRDGVKLDHAFLDVSSLVEGGVLERGLLGLAFAPDYARSGRFYVYYTAPNAAHPAGQDLVLDEFRRSSTEPDQADPTTRRTVLTIPHWGGTGHNGGQLAFGPDGDLYLGPGDGGCCNDPLQNGQNLDVLLGKILRIDPRQSGNQPYSVPPDNPFVGVSGAQPEIWAYGVRNPWRFSFDRATADLVIADVGEGQREEVDFAPRSQGGGAGDNYGWSCFEGTLIDKISPPCPPAGPTVSPALELYHSDGACAIIGGYVIRDPALGSLDGRYLFGDLCDGKLRTAVLQGPSAPDVQELGQTFASGHLASFGEDDCGHLYAIDRTGPLYRIDGSSFTPCAEPPSQTPASEGLPQPPPAAAEQPTRRAVGKSLVWLGGAKRQHVLRDRGLLIGVTCNQRCSVLAGATIQLGRAAAVVRLRGVRRSLGLGERRRVRLRLSARTRRRLERVLTRGRSRTAIVVATATDATGARISRSRKVSVVR